MRSVRGRALVLGAFCGLSTVTAVHSAALAQQPPPPESAPPPAGAPAPPPQAPPPAAGQPGPAEPAPAPPPPPGYYPPGYGPPPGYYPPQYYTPPPPPPPPSVRGVYRPFTIGLGLGLGTLALRDGGDWDGEAALAYGIRVGFGVTRNWLVWVGLDGATAHRNNLAFSQTGYMLGAQFFPLRQLYLRAGLGLASVSADDGLFLDVDRGTAILGAIGFEVAQGYNTALAFELATMVARYPDDTWNNTGVNFVINFF